MQKYTAIILSHTSANEFNRIYTMYTKEAGMLRVAGKGIRKANAKLAGHLEPGTLSEVYVARSKGMGQITSAITVDSFGNIKKDFQKLQETLKIFRFFLKNFSEGQKDRKIFQLVSDFLKLTDHSKSSASGIVVEAFWWKLFDALGHGPEVMKCTGCDGRLRVNSKKHFSVEKGGIVCADCNLNFRNLIPISDNQIKLLRVFWGNPLEKVIKVKVSKSELEKLSRIRENFRKYNF